MRYIGAFWKVVQLKMPVQFLLFRSYEYQVLFRCLGVPFFKNPGLLNKPDPIFSANGGYLFQVGWSGR